MSDATVFSPWPEVLARAEASPATAWKVLNLEKRPDAVVDDYPEW